MKSWLQTNNNVPKSWKSSLVAQMVKNLPAMQETQVWSLSWEDPLEKGMAISTPVFLPREFHRQRSLEGYSPWAHKESDMTELSLFFQKLKMLSTAFYIISTTFITHSHPDTLVQQESGRVFQSADFFKMSLCKSAFCKVTLTYANHF